MIETTLTLADGRSLGMAEWGPPDAPVVVYCHGFPGSRLEPSLAQAVVEQRSVNARVIAFDRPGYGRSTFVRNRTFIDWPADMAEAADRLGVGEFSVLGASGGCPYALACASVLGARVTRVGIVAGVGPLDATGMPESQLISGPSNLRILRTLQWRLVARAARTDRVDTVIDRTVTTMTGVDREAMKRPDVRAWYRTMFTEAFDQGAAAASYEAELYRQLWGFDPADITTETNLWHGAVDQWVPISVARWLADRIPNAHLIEWPDHGHVSWAGSDEAADIVAVTAGKRAGPVR